MTIDFEFDSQEAGNLLNRYNNFKRKLVTDLEGLKSGPEVEELLSFHQRVGLGSAFTLRPLPDSDSSITVKHNRDLGKMTIEFCYLHPERGIQAVNAEQWLKIVQKELGGRHDTKGVTALREIQETIISQLEDTAATVLEAAQKLGSEPASPKKGSS